MFTPYVLNTYSTHNIDNVHERPAVRITMSARDARAAKRATLKTGRDARAARRSAMQARTVVPLRFSGERKGPATVREKEEPNTNDMPRDVGAQETDAKLGTVILRCVDLEEATETAIGCRPDYEYQCSKTLQVSKTRKHTTFVCMHDQCPSKRTIVQTGNIATIAYISTPFTNTKYIFDILLHILTCR
jgi:hypothetical protein